MKSVLARKKQEIDHLKKDRKTFFCFEDKVPNKDKKQNFLINKKYFFIYTDKNIRHFKIEHDHFEEQKGKDAISFQIDQTEDLKEHNRIKGVFSGSNPDLVIIQFDMSKEKDIVFTWDLINNIESQQSEIGKNYEITWDCNGIPLIITPENAIYDGLNIMSFDLDEETLERPQNNLRRYKGHRFDGKNQNWFIIKQYLSLSFSFMSFVIKDKIEEKCPLQKGNIFDIEPYNYIFNKKTIFLDSDIVTENAEELSYILENMKALNFQYLDLLSYYQEYYKEVEEHDGTKKMKRMHITPLLKAFKSGNN